MYQTGRWGATFREFSSIAVCLSSLHQRATIDMKNTSTICALLLASMMIMGCATTGAFNAANVTDVQLSEANYEVVATNVRGKASAGYLIGVSGGIYRQMKTAALVRVSGSGMLYGEALENLWENFREEYGETDGRELALVNVRYDTDALNLFVYTSPTVSVRADVVEFTE